MPMLHCQRCGKELESIDVTPFGSRERVFIAAGECPCPGPRCPLSGGRLDERGRCQDIDCVLLLNVVPIPEMA
jgi:hypothetical protein